MPTYPGLFAGLPIPVLAFNWGLDEALGLMVLASPVAVVLILVLVIYLATGPRPRKAYVKAALAGFAFGACIAAVVLAPHHPTFAAASAADWGEWCAAWALLTCYIGVCAAYVALGVASLIVGGEADRCLGWLGCLWAIAIILFPLVILVFVLAS